MAKKKSTRPPVQTLDSLLIVVLFVLLISVGGGIYYAYQNLTKAAQSANQSIENLQKENAPIQNIDAITTQNQQYADILNITPRLSVSPQEVQSVGTDDINRYASLTGLHISSISYGNSNDNDTNISGGAGQKNEDNIIKINSSTPVSMKSILQFIKLLENNLPIMYLTEVTITGTDSDKVSLDSMSIGVQTK